MIVDEIYMLCRFKEDCSVTNVMSLKKYVTFAVSMSTVNAFCSVSAELKLSPR